MSNESGPTLQLSDKVEELFRKWNRPGSPGAAVLAIRYGHVVFRKGFGYANLEHGIPVSPSTVFHVASLSKQFTAMAIAMLALQNRLSLDDNVRTYLPDVPDFGKTITIRHLVHHTSGLRDQWELLVAAGWRMDDVITQEHILEMVRRQRQLNFDPGEQYLYSNTGYTLLAEIVTRVSGHPFADYCSSHIFEPLGMSDTRFSTDYRLLTSNRADSYAPEVGGGWQRCGLSYANVGATGLLTTIDDLAKWLLNFDNPKIGGATLIRRMHQTGVLNSGKPISYAFGLQVGQYRGLRMVAHSGGDAGFRCHMARFPDAGFSFAVLGNATSMAEEAGVLMQLPDLFLADELPPPERLETGAPAALLGSAAGEYIMSSGTLLTLQVEGSRMVALARESMPREFLRTTDGELRSPDGMASLAFSAGAEGHSDRLTLCENDQVFVGKRLFRLELGSAELSEYEGDYASDELGTAYTIAAEPHGLVALHPRHGRAHLVSVGRDLFVGSQLPFGSIQFERQAGKIAGFLLSSTRAQGMRFDLRCATPGRS